MTYYSKQNTNGAPKPKPGNKQWLGPRGNAVKKDAPPNPLASFINNDASLREAIGDTQLYDLDRGERNEPSLRVGTLTEKSMPNSVYLSKIKKRYGCIKHANTREERFCYLPPQGRYVGEHLRMDMSVTSTIISYMVSRSETVPVCIYTESIYYYRGRTPTSMLKRTSFRVR